MAVNSPLPIAANLKPVAGIELGYAEAGIKKANRKDLLVMRLAPGATVAGVFTTNRFCAAPVQVSKAHLDAVNQTGKNIRATYSRNEAILGGAIARVGSTVYDGSVKGQLERIRQQLMA